MENIKLKANKLGYKERDRRLKEQFINGISDKESMTEIIRELIARREAN